jgi:hypothetical protein
VIIPELNNQFNTVNNDWYLAGKIKFLARKVFTDENNILESQNFTINEICSKGLCSVKK